MTFPSVDNADGWLLEEAAPSVVHVRWNNVYGSRGPGDDALRARLLDPVEQFLHLTQYAVTRHRDERGPYVRVTRWRFAGSASADGRLRLKSCGSDSRAASETASGARYVWSCTSSHAAFGSLLAEHQEGSFQCRQLKLSRSRTRFTHGSSRANSPGWARSLVEGGKFSPTRRWSPGSCSPTSRIGRNASHWDHVSPPQWNHLTAQLRAFLREVEHFRGAHGGELESRPVEAASRSIIQRFELALQRSPIVVYSQDTELRYTWVYNPHPDFDAREHHRHDGRGVLPAGRAGAATGHQAARHGYGRGDPGNDLATLHGTPTYYDLTVEPLYDAHGVIIGVTGAATDITALMRTEQALARSEAQLNEARRIAQIGSWEWNAVTEQVTMQDLLELRRLAGDPPPSDVTGFPAEASERTPESAGATMTGNESRQPPGRRARSYALQHFHRISSRRPRVHERLTEGWGRPLMLVCAPAGFGKTIALAGWLHDARRPWVWVSLDELDSDLVSFTGVLVSALGTVIPDAGRQALDLVAQTESPALSQLSALLASDLAAVGHELVIVLDDFHLIQEGAIHALLSLLVRRLPPTIQLVIASREEPLLPVALTPKPSRFTKG